MKLSPRNVLKGKADRYSEDAVNAQDVVELPGDQEIVSVVTKSKVTECAYDLISGEWLAAERRSVGQNNCPRRHRGKEFALANDFCTVDHIPLFELDNVNRNVRKPARGLP